MIVALLFFVAYSVVVFIAPNWIWLASFSAFNLLLCLIFRTGFVQTLKNLLKVTLFAVFVFLINLIFDDVISCLIVAWKLLIVCNFTFIFGKIFKPTMIASGFAQLLFPLKLFKVDTESIALAITIALQFIPILSRSAKSLSKTLKVRGFKFNIKNILTNGHVIFMLFFSEIFKRVDSIELAFRARGYNAEK